MDSIKDTTVTNTENDNKINHLIVLQHGLHATYQDFNSIISRFEKENFENCEFVAAKSNSYFLATRDGIDKVGNRLFVEVKELYEKYNHPKKISFIGHSLGGLVARYAIGLLYRDGFFKICEPDQFISLSSPHCGSRRPSTTVFNKVAHYFVDSFLSVTGRQLILHDSDLPDNIKVFPDTSNLPKGFENTTTSSNDPAIVSSPPLQISSPSIEVYKSVGNDEKLTIIEKKEENEVITNDQEVPMPLLVKMTEGIFFEGLKLFRKRILYSNIYNDIQVNFCTSDISAKNPYTLGKIMKFTEKYSHIIEEETLLDIDPKLLEEEINSKNQNENQPKIEKTKKLYAISKHNHQDKIEDYFRHDTHHLYLKRILTNLRKLDFVRYHMYFKNFLSHTNIVVKRDWVNSEGWDIVHHLVDHFEP
ncbi:hypothetical protein DICPUDRAFT_147284 [Dictyostelium purpureum]|uniref:DUF676 domain-containing protein n=1 Tax=Dictyostelium purpureum TaxID=5786 RepID=F0Z840_DICPU|nr:uncharacterized protein DICPUDRAFT_147284 [Dictyostelium purpureum]EGC39862.1 hypothetical protein DICPUDRAFT_147284 [Dictyostelium purpureum]|eukprot:XP_003283613.1 hypothetical protein DICPUDRAFT_147284 [Dictyostelium purpureum]